MDLRTNHQPAAEITPHETPSEEQFRTICGKTAAFILALDINTTPLKVPSDAPFEEPHVCKEAPRPLQKWQGKTLIEQTHNCAQNCHFASVSILASPALHLPKKLTKNVDIYSYDIEADRAISKASSFFELYGLSKGILEDVWQLIEQDSQIESVMFLSCDQIRLTPAHLYEVCEEFNKNPQLDCVTSWITWARSLPILVSRSLLGETIHNMSPKERFLPALHVKEHVFGEERLEANAPIRKSCEEFFAGLTLSAREAVQIAHEQMHSKRKKLDKNHFSNPDLLAIQTAKKSIQALSKKLSIPAKKHLLEADAWAKSNIKNFPLLLDSRNKNSLAFLDSAATSQRCFQALQAQENFDKHENANVYRGAYELSAQATASLNNARAALEAYIGANRRETVYTKNTSDSLNLIALAWGEHNIKKDDIIVTTIAEHHSNYLPWLALAQRKEAHLEIIPLREDGRLDLQVYEQLLEKNPKLVCIAHVSNVLGIKNPIKEMAKKAHEHGARFVLDAAQSIPHSSINVYKTKADFVAFSAHKMYGPLGIGALWIHPDAFKEMDPLALGGGTISHAALDSYYLRVGAIQYELGTPAVSQAIGWSAAIDFMNSLDVKDRKNHTTAMTHALAVGLKDIWGITIWGDHSKTDGQNGLVAFSLEGVSPSQLAQFCAKFNVAIRSGSHCAIPLAASLGIMGTGRASIAVHTTLEDIEALLTAVRLCSKLYWEV